MQRNSNISTLSDIASKLYGNRFEHKSKIYYCEPGHAGFVKFCADDGVSYALPEIQDNTPVRVLDDAAIVIGKGRASKMFRPVHYLRVSYLEEVSIPKPNYIQVTVPYQNVFLIGHRVERDGHVVTKVLNQDVVLKSKYIKIAESARAKGVQYTIRIYKKGKKGYDEPLRALAKAIQPLHDEYNKDAVEYFLFTLDDMTSKNDGEYTRSGCGISLQVSVYKNNPEE